MTDEPLLDKQRLARTILLEYGVSVGTIDFLPIGFDVRSSAYRCVDSGGSEYFLKLRQLTEEQVRQLPIATFVLSTFENTITPILNRSASQYWSGFDSFQLSLYPFVSGVTGWNYRLAVDQWLEVGKMIRSLHELPISETLAHSMPVEQFSRKWRIRATEYLNGSDSFRVVDSSGKAFIALLREKRAILLDIVEQAENLAETLETQDLKMVCCHGDLHSGNFMVDQHRRVFAIDWDTVCLAPKEKDLMFIRAGIGGMLDDSQGVLHFYEGYGEIALELSAIKYYRFERIIQDVVSYCEQLLDTSEGGGDREEMVSQFARQFEKNGVVEMAYST